uniref:KIB1-4 beta-propeller domain-containing protein n=1 Tax=Leersia perrieri TaxID=77586 RepID=A0A0D9XDD9_9ORYZ
MSDEDEHREASDEDDDGISEDDETDISNDDNTADEAKEVNDTLLMYNISTKQLLANNRLDDLKDHFYWIKPQEVDVYKLDIPRRAWVKVDTLGNRAFFVDTIECFGASVNAKEVCMKENCIYFVRRRDKGLYVHSMERGTTTAINPGADLLDNVTAQILMPAS